MYLVSYCYTVLTLAEGIAVVSYHTSKCEGDRTDLIYHSYAKVTTYLLVLE